ncbi:hypothetical protein ES332_D05G335800v1 [Gossypium tomentosum]|uniref:PsbP C-terminal domain-containing protein n=1 Tax=Gossypium tomentosum TaxID=34277 RepID=A0A5D2L2T0_GOSTO|nr:hypothetical protein ES332_D05G335800v1 [Gossypium tomentosum]
MAALQNSMPSLHHTLFTNSFPQRGLQKLSHGAFLFCKTSVPLHVWGEHLSSPPAAASSSSQFQDSGGRRRMIAVGIIAPLVSIVDRTPIAFAAETKKGFLPVTDKKDGYTFLYPFGWQEVVIEGQDKVFKDVIEPLESVSVNMIPTSKQDIRDFGSPQEVAETLIKKVLAPPTQKTKLIQAGEHLVLTMYIQTWIQGLVHENTSYDSVYIFLECSPTFIWTSFSTSSSNYPLVVL